MATGDPCPYCGYLTNITLDTRPTQWGRLRRKKCTACGQKWSTRELPSTSISAIAKLQRRLLQAAELFEELQQLTLLIKADQALLQILTEDELERELNEPPVKFIAEDNTYGQTIQGTSSKLLHPKASPNRTEVADDKVSRTKRR